MTRLREWRRIARLRRTARRHDTALRRVVEAAVRERAL